MLCKLEKDLGAGVSISYLPDFNDVLGDATTVVELGADIPSLAQMQALTFYFTLLKWMTDAFDSLD